MSNFEVIRYYTTVIRKIDDRCDSRNQLINTLFQQPGRDWIKLTGFCWRAFDKLTNARDVLHSITLDKVSYLWAFMQQLCTSSDSLPDRISGCCGHCDFTTPDWRSWDLVSPSPLLSSAFRVLSQAEGRLYLWVTLLSVGLIIHIWMASLTPLSNHFGSTSKILTLFKLMLWSG